MDTGAKDPRLWDVAEVQQWARKTFVFGESLAECLFNNDVDGAVLLKYINSETLKSDIGVKSLGQRVKIVEKVAELSVICSIVSCGHSD
jgi:hypothetical protein